MRDKSMRRMCAAVMIVCFAVAGFGAPVVAAQFGGLKDAARKAKEAMQKKKDAEAQAQKEAEAKKESEAKKEAEPQKGAEAKEDTQAKKEPSAAVPAGAAGAPDFQSFSKFDFVPGENIIGFEDFMQDAIGDFPAQWNTNASGEVVTVAGKPGRWLKLTAGGFFTPEFVKALPDNFTIEFDVLTPPTFNGYSLVAAICELPSEGARNWHVSHNAVKLSISPGNGGDGQSGTELRHDGTTISGNSKYTGQFTKTKNPVHISLWRQRQRLRVYWNEEKLWDLPRAFAPAPKLNGLVFGTNQTQEKSEFYLSNIRLAVGAPDTRNKLLTEGKWVTHGILFDVNSDRVKPESYGALKEIAGVLTENADVKIQIVGHTDADGDDAKNLDLSKRRAASVRAVLAKEFAIAEARMETDGKGESQPIDKNDTSAGKANNRRVEFIKK